MSNSATVSRAQLTYGLCLPLAALIGFFLADPMQSSTVVVVGLVAGVLCWPLFARWHHALLVFSLNSAFVLAFLPGRLPLWMYVAFGGLLILVFRRCLDPYLRLVPPGGVGWALLALGGVVLFTMVMRGGIGLQMLGGATIGGRKYVYVLLGIAAYFIVASRPVPGRQAMLYMGLFCLSGMTGLLSHLVYAAGGKFYWLYSFIDSSPAAAQAMAEWDVQQNTAVRTGAAMGAASAMVGYLMARYGLGGTADFKRPFRLLLLGACLAGGMVGGFRSFVVLTGLFLTILFFLEGLHRTRFVVWAAVAAVAAYVCLAMVAPKLPLGMQRTLSFLPIPVSSQARLDAEGSLEWRLQMWRALSGQVPAHLLVGKGYVTDPAALQMSGFNAHFGFGIQAEWAMLTSDYHNGPFSVLIPFGLWGGLAMVWLFAAGILRLRWFCRHGHPQMLTINRVLLAMFLTSMMFFLFFFGALESDLVRFAILLGLAEALNAGTPAAVPEPAETALPLRDLEAQSV